MMNQFKNNIPPAKDVISNLIGRDAKPHKKLTPPVFGYEPVTMVNPGIAWGMSLVKIER